MKIVKKVWGLERWIVNTKFYCGKILELNKGFQCSIHRHLIKDETFYVLEGEIWMELGNASMHLYSGHVVRVRPRQWHRFTGIKDSKIIEFSTQHFENDSYRRTESRKVPILEWKIIKGQFYK